MSHRDGWVTSRPDLERTPLRGGAIEPRYEFSATTTRRPLPIATARRGRETLASPISPKKPALQSVQIATIKIVSCTANSPMEDDEKT